MIVERKCPDCGNMFKVKQSSRRTYCKRCANKRVLAGKKSTR